MTTKMFRFISSSGEPWIVPASSVDDAAAIIPASLLASGPVVLEEATEEMQRYLEELTITTPTGTKTVREMIDLAIEQGKRSILNPTLTGGELRMLVYEVLLPELH
jgi:hypothetical protein